MKKNKRFPAFFGGMLATLVLYTCVTTALAASGTVTFNAVNVSFNGMEVFKKGETLQVDSGATIPSSILYTDENGGNTTYVPIKKVAEVFQMPVEWDESSDKVTVRVDGELRLYTMSLNTTDWSIDNCIKGVEPIIPQGGTEVLAQVDHHSLEAFTANVQLTSGNGRYVSVTVTNHNNKPVEFGLGKFVSRDEQTDSTILFPTQIPAGETVTRTIEFISPEDQVYFPFYLFVGYTSDTYSTRPVNITVSAVQFEG